jgi:hypothetical protein
METLYHGDYLKILRDVITDNDLKTKAKVEKLSNMLLNDEANLVDFIEFAKCFTGSDKGTCIEAIEFATRVRPQLASVSCLKFVTETLLDKAPRVRWESAKIIRNIAHLYPNELNKAVGNLLENSEFPGTVVRWSAASALSEIVKMKTKKNKDLIPAVEAILRREPDAAIQKIYQKALKAVAAD